MAAATVIPLAVQTIAVLIQAVLVQAVLARPQPVIIAMEQAK